MIRSSNIKTHLTRRLEEDMLAKSIMVVGQMERLSGPISATQEALRADTRWNTSHSS